MIFEYDNSGFIFHVIHDPVPKGMRAALEAEGKQFKEYPPVPLPEVQIGTDEEGNPIMESPGTETLEVDGLRDWFDGVNVVDRPTFDLPETVDVEIGDTIELVDIPAGTSVSLEGSETLIDETGTLTISADMQAEYTLRFRLWPYIDHQMKVTVHGAA